MEIQHECFKMSVPLEAWHWEVTTRQFEFAREYGNPIVLQVIEDVATKHDIASLLKEKPSAGIHGSGKYNQRSLPTASRVPLFLPGAHRQGCKQRPSIPRLHIASPKNNFRCSAML